MKSIYVINVLVQLFEARKNIIYTISYEKQTEKTVLLKPKNLARYRFESNWTIKMIMQNVGC